VKYNKLYLYLWGELRSDRSTDFHARWLKRRDSRKDVLFFWGGGLLILLHLVSQIAQKINSVGVNRRFQADRAKYLNFRIIKTSASIITKFCKMTETNKYP